MFKALIVVLLLVTSVFSSTISKKKILVLHSYHNDVPWVKEINQGLENSKKKYPNFEFYIENFDGLRIATKKYNNKVIDLIKIKYQSIKFDGIIVDSFYAKDALSSYDKEFYPNTPKVFNVRAKKFKDKNVLSIFFNREKAIDKTIDLAFNLDKNSNKVVLIKGNWGDGPEFEKQLLEKIKNYPNKSLEIIENFSKEQLISKVKSLDPNSTIFYSVVSRDKNGKKIVPKHLLQELISLKQNRFYSLYTTLLNTGIVGGYMTSGVKSAEKMVEALYDYISTGKYKSYYYNMNYYVDWEILKKLDIDEKNIPTEAIILNKPKSIFEVFFYESLLTIIFILSLLALLLVLTKLVYKMRALNKQLKVETKQKLEKQDLLNQQAKNALMGEMIHNIAHQWRQPLTRINSNIAVIDLLMMKENIDRKKVDEKLVNIEEQTSYMSSTIDDFSSFFSPDKLKSNFKVYGIVKKSMELLSSRLKEIDVKYNLDEKVELNSYENELSQVILAIVNNAIDNFKLKEVESPLLQISLNDLNSSIEIKIQDNGGGISEEIIDKIFEAHFSTKKDIKSSGLGLYISKNIIENSMNGKLEVKNSEDGVLFTMVFKKEIGE